MLYGPDGQPLTRESVFEVLPVLDTSAYANGDVLFVPVEVPSFFPAVGTSRILYSLQLLDEDAQGVAFDLVFLNAMQDIGTLNAAVAITDTEARSIAATHRIVAGDWVDWSNFKLFEAGNIGKVLRGIGTSLWLGAIARSTPTFTASGLKIRIGVL